MRRFAVNAYSEWKLNDTQLKIIACASMLADHICYVLFPYAKAAEIIRATAGRIAFPIYCFLLVEGFLHTKNRIFYCLRLAVLRLFPKFSLTRLSLNPLSTPGTRTCSSPCF